MVNRKGDEKNKAFTIYIYKKVKRENYWNDIKRRRLFKKNKRREKKETKLRIITNHFYLFFSHLVITTRPVEILSHNSGLSLAVSLIHKMTKDKKKGGGGQKVTLE